MSIRKHLTDLLEAAIDPWLPFGPTRYIDGHEYDLSGRQLIELDRTATADERVLRAQLPGLDANQDIDVDVQGHLLVISAERHEEEDDPLEAGHHHNRSFARTVVLPDGVDPEEITASYRDGVLEVRVPAVPPADDVCRRVPIAV